jgi:predicted ATPase
MRLASLRMEGFRRFAEATTIDLGPSVIAIVGPNEAGKSSLLDALSRVSREDAFADGDFSGRERPADDQEVILSVEYVIEGVDREALGGIPGAEAIRFYRVFKRGDGGVDRKLEPEIGRPIGDRERVRGDLLRAAKHRKLGPDLNEPPIDEEPADQEEEMAARALADLLLAIAEGLETTDDTLDDDLCELIDEAVARIERIEFTSPKYVVELPTRLQELTQLSRSPHPNDRALEILMEAEPPIYLMGGSARELKSDYNFDEYDDAPEPLANLLAVAKVDYQELKAVSAEPGQPKLTTLKNRANENLERSIRSSWRQGHPTEQGTITVAIDVQGRQLQVWPLNIESGNHSRIDERSDGLRSFLSLLAFTTRHAQGGKPILLIDEAEIHLHYAAQAELVEVFTSQELAAQIIYTTHSAGCLPDDLGSGVRVVETTGAETSTTHDGFWAERQAGFSPLLLSMGASALAFTPTRAAVMAEGPSDALLLPQLLRVAVELPSHEPLGFQVAPGIAWVPDEELGLMDLEASKVVYLLDSDDDGERHRKRLKDAGISANRVFMLKTPKASGLSVEDFVAPRTYVASINYLLRHMRGVETEVRVSDIEGNGIARRCETWLKRRKIKPVPKPKVAEEILRQVRPTHDSAHPPPPLLDPRRKSVLVKLHRQIQERLGVESLRPSSD